MKLCFDDDCCLKYVVFRYSFCLRRADFPFKWKIARFIDIMFDFDSLT